MHTLNDPILGELKFDAGWRRSYRARFFGKERDCELSIRGDEVEEIEDGQRAAFVEFEQNKEKLLNLVPEAIHAYYQTTLSDLYAGETSASASHRGYGIEQLEESLTLRTVLVPHNFRPNERLVGLLIECDWLPEVGLAVVFLNGELSEVGPQDIIL
jgi:hypothetical protein